MLRKAIVVAAVAAGALTASAGGASACHQQVVYTSCYTPCTTSYADECVVYRWDWCYCQWVVDSVYPACNGALAYAEWQASWRVYQLQCWGISAYSRCFVASCTVYWYNWATCQWVVYIADTNCDYAAYLVNWLRCQGYCAYSSCDLRPVYPATTSSPQAPTSEPAKPTPSAPAAPPAPPAPPPTAKSS